MGKWKCVLTNAGEALLAAAPGRTLKITRAVCGSNSVEESSLHEQTEIDEIKKEMQITEIKTKANVTSLRLQLTNENIWQSFEFNQIGIFARLDQDDEVLYMILQVDADSLPDIVPTNKKNPGYVYECLISLILSGSEDIVANIDNAAFTTIGHTHSAEDINSGVLALEHGGTGASTPAGLASALKLRASDISYARSLEAWGLRIAYMESYKITNEAYRKVFFDKPFRSNRIFLFAMYRSGEIIPPDDISVDENYFILPASVDVGSEITWFAMGQNF